MNDFSGMEELMHDFLVEASDLLAEIDSKLMGLEKTPHDHDLLNVIFRGLHTIKGGAGFLNATELVNLCHLTENLFNKLRNDELALTAELMDVIFAATREVRQMFGALAQNRQPDAAPPHIIAALHAALKGEAVAATTASQAVAPQVIAPHPIAPQPAALQSTGELDWNLLYQALVGGAAVATTPQPSVLSPQPSVAPAPSVPPSAVAPSGQRPADVPGNKILPADRRKNEAAKSNTIQVDTGQFDQVLNLSGEIGLTKNRLTHLRSDMLQERSDSPTLRALDQAVSQLDMLVVSLQNTVMKMRMQPIGWLFNEYPRLARDLARQLGKNVDVVLSGEDTEIDKTIIEDLNELLVHLIRNVVDHGVEDPEQRTAAGKPEKSLVHLGARQEGDHILITIADDGKGMHPEMIRNKAIEKGLISAESAGSLNDKQSLDLIFLPGFSANDEISSVSGCGVGMDVVKTNIQKLKGTISITSEPGKGSKFTIVLPIKLAILPVLLLRLCNQSFAVPLSLARGVLSISPDELQLVSGKPIMVVRGKVLPVLPLAKLIGWKQTEKPEVGVLMQAGSSSFILSADGFIGRDDVMVKSLDTFRPKGVAGVTMSSEGGIVLILDIKELLGEIRGRSS